MAKKKKQDERQQLSDILRRMLGQKATVRILEECAPDVIEHMEAGVAIPSIAELIVKKLVRLALDPKRANQWAMELIWERMEGKAAQGNPPEDDGRLLEERLDAITTQHLNAIANQISDQRFTGETAAEEPAAGCDQSHLDVPEDESGSAEDDSGEPEMETAIIQAGPGGF